MLLDDLPADAQSQAAAAVAVLVGFLGRVKRLEDQAELVGRDADPTVGHADLRHVRALILVELEAETAATRHRLAGIDDQIEEDLLDLSRYHRGLRPFQELFL